MAEVTRQNACKKLTENIIKQSKQGLQNLTTKDVKWEKVVTPMLEDEINDAQKHMNALKDALSQEVSYELSELITRSDSIKKAIVDNLNYSKTWKRWGALSSVFFGIGTPNLWQKCLDELKQARKKAKQEELKKQREELKKQREALQKQREEKLKQEEKPQAGDSLKRSASAPVIPSSPPPPPPLNLPPPPPLISKNAIPTVQNPELKEIKKLIEDFRKNANQLSKEEKTKKLKEIKNKAKQASEKYFGEKSPITKKVLRKSNIKKFITKISKRIGKEKEFLWPLLLANESQYEGLKKSRLEWEAAVNKLKKNNKDLYEQVKAYGIGFMSTEKQNLYNELKEDIDKQVLDFVKRLTTMRDSGIKTYNSLKKLIDNENKQLDNENKQPKISKKLWYESEKYAWVKKYVEDENKQSIYLENIKDLISSEICKSDNLPELKDLKKDYEKVYDNFAQLENKLNKTKKEQKQLDRFERQKSTLDRKFQEVKELINRYENDKDFQFQLTDDKTIIDKDIRFMMVNRSSITLDALLNQLLTKVAPKLNGKINMQELLENIMNGNKKVKKIEKIDIESLKP